MLILHLLGRVTFERLLYLHASYSAQSNWVTGYRVSLRHFCTCVLGSKEKETRGCEVDDWMVKIAGQRNAFLEVYKSTLCVSFGAHFVWVGNLPGLTTSDILRGFEREDSVIKAYHDNKSSALCTLHRANRQRGTVSRAYARLTY
jgi:hypothetical protein